MRRLYAKIVLFVETAGAGSRFFVRVSVVLTNFRYGTGFIRAATVMFHNARKIAKTLTP